MGTENAAVRLHGARLRFPGPQPREVVLPDLEIAPGESVAVTGPSGSGKSTLLQVISGLRTLQEGEAFVLGHALHAMPESARDRFRGKQIGMVHQRFHLLSGFTVLENVLAGLRLGRQVPRGARPGRAKEMLARVGLGDRLSAKTAVLSVGECQRVVIARALAGHPELLLADEPTGALDPDNRDRVLVLMQTLCAELGCTWICVTHDPVVAGQFGRVLALGERKGGTAA